MSFGSGSFAAASYAGMAELSVKTISDALNAWRSQSSNRDPQVLFFDLELDAGQWEYLVSGYPRGPTITFKGNSYRTVDLEVGELRQNVEGELRDVDVTVSNISGEAAQVIETNDLEGNLALLTWVPLSEVGSGDEFSEITERFRVQDAVYNRREATINLGVPEMKDRVPFRDYNRQTCGWSYPERHLRVDGGCRYPSWEFGDDMAIDLAGTAPANTEHIFGVQAVRGLNLLHATAGAEIVLGSGVLRIAIDDAVSPDHLWEDASRNGPFVYRVLAQGGIIEVYTRVDIPTRQASGYGGILFQDSVSTADWVLLALEVGDGVTTMEENGRVLSRVTTSSSSDDVFEDIARSVVYLRAVYDGLSFAFYYSDEEDADWILHRTRTKPAGMTGDLRIGLAVAQPAAASYDAEWEFPYLRYKSGGLTKCDLSLDGPDGCRVHDWTKRFRAFTGIPRA